MLPILFYDFELIMPYSFLTKNISARKFHLLILLALLLVWQHVFAQNNLDADPRALSALPSNLNPINFVHLLSTRNADVLIGKLNTGVGKELYNSESGIYEPIAYSSIKKEGRFRLNTVEEQIVSSNLPYLSEQVLTTEAGIKEKLPTGADASLGYQVSRRNNNLISTQTSGLFSTEYTSALVFTLKQPLLRNAGRDMTETSKKIAELDFLISKEQFKQQLFKSTLDGLNLYWQVYKNQRALELHDDAFKQSQELLKNAIARLKAGKISESALLEIRSMMLQRSSEYQRSKQAFFDAKLKLFSSLGSKNVLGLDLYLDKDEINPVASPWLTPDTFVEPADVLKESPLFAIATLRKQQAEIKLANLRNQTKPDLDFVMSASGNGFAYNQGDAARDARGRTYPDWYVGFSLEVPLGGNHKASGQYAAQIERLTQAEIEINSLTITNANDFLSVIEDSKISYQAVQHGEQEGQRPLQQYRRQQNFVSGPAAKRRRCGIAANHI